MNISHFAVIIFFAILLYFLRELILNISMVIL